MRTRLIILLFLLMFIASGLTAVGAGLAVLAPLHPGEPGFALQDAAEQSMADLILDADKQAEYHLELLERRSSDVLNAPTVRLVESLACLDRELERTLVSLAGVSDQNAPYLRKRLTSDLRLMADILNRLQAAPGMRGAALEALQSRAGLLLSLLQDSAVDLSNLIAGAGRQPEVMVTLTPFVSFALTATPARPAMDSRWVRFPDGSRAAQHLFFPLTGQHGSLDCFDCHDQGRYRGTPNLCSTCHLQAAPAGHYPGECSSCHTTGGWLPATFNHQAAGATNCLSCHTSDRPANHYQGQCSACHSTSAWLPATFNHQAAGATDCQSCHLPNRPANHYQGQCSSCHSTSAWRPASFNHQAAGATDCQSCHLSNRPANHFQGQCSSCHSTSGWRPASFNHQAAGATDCIACHLGRRPANHFDGQCSNCHSTSSWSGATFAHGFPLNHGGARGECAKCHPGGTGSYTCFTCHDQAKMDKKHNEKGIPDYVSRCMECHSDGRKHDD